MKQSKHIKSIGITLLVGTVLALSAVLGAANAASQEGAAARFFVSIPASVFSDLTTAAAFDRLGLAPVTAIDYGAFRWVELNAADYAALESAGLEFTAHPQAGQVSVARFAFDPLAEGEPNLPARLRADGSGPGLRLVKLAGPVKDDWLRQIEAAGLIPLQYYPYNSYLVWGDQAQAETVESLDFVRWQGAFHPAYKLSPALNGLSGEIRNVAVTLYNDGALGLALEQIIALGGQLVQVYPAQPDGAFYTAIFTLSAERLADAARVNTVWAVEYASPQPAFDDEVGAQIVAGNVPGGVPPPGFYDWLAARGVDGGGITWADVDTGLNANHDDLTGRAVAFIAYPGAPAANTDPDGHGSHTAGAIMADPRLSEGGTGQQDPNSFYWGSGMAPESNLVVQNALMGSAWPPAGGWQILSRDSVLNGAIGSSNSWYTGASGAQGYSAAARTHDIMVRDANFDTPSTAEPIIMVFSAGNAGPSPSSMTEPKEAKNLITVGASNNYPRVGSSINDLASFSSRGPALDGRLLPNVIAPGVQTASLNGTGSATCGTIILSGEDGYNYCQGTSMAAPFVSGASALIADWWEQEGWGVPSPAMVKALLINGAADMIGGSGVTANIPNNNQGWGRVNLGSVIRNGQSNVYYDQDVLFHNTGDTWTLRLGVVDPAQPLKITLVWSDAPGAVLASPALVNNLNLTVVNGGSTYRGNVFSSGWSTPGGSYDTLNNIENVYIQNPGLTAVITIDALNIAGDGVPYNGDTTDQDFALVCYNCTVGQDFTLEVSPVSQEVCALDMPAADYAVTLEAILNFSQTVTLSAHDAPSGTLAVFDPNPIIPPGVSDLSFTDLISGAWGVYEIDIVGAAITRVHTATVGLALYTAFPLAPQALYPEAEANNVPILPTFTWAAALQAQSYTIEVATDAAFDNIVEAASGLTTTHYTPALTLATNTVYYWRVRAVNTCGFGDDSTVHRFLTEPAYGQCALGTTPDVLLNEGFEVDPAGWGHDGTGDTWTRSDIRSHSGDFSFYALAPNTVSDQRLWSAPVALPLDQSPLTLEFWDYRRFQTGGCYDGSILEITTDGGGAWTQLESELIFNTYTGQITGVGNPLNGLNAWCNIRMTWAKALVDLDGFAGQTAQFRWRLGSDNAISSIGWFVDDVVVQACMPAAALGPESSLEGGLGAVVTHTFVLDNAGETDAYTLALSGSQWQTELPGGDVITVTGATSATIQVAVTIPETALTLVEAGVLFSDTFTLTAASLNIPGMALSTAGETLAVAELGVSMTPISQTAAAAPGMLVDYLFTVANTGDIADTFDLAVSSAWGATLSITSTGELAAGDSISVTLTVAVPAYAVHGAYDLATLTAVSVADSGVFAVAQARTEVIVEQSSSQIYLPLIAK